MNIKSRKLEYFLISLLILLLAVIFNLKDLFGGGIFNGVIFDNGPPLEFYPWEVFNLRTLMDGHIPLWDHGRGIGVPHLANLQANPFYPLKWLIYILPYWISLDIFLMLRLGLAGVATYALLLEMRIGRLGALLASAAFTFSGYLMGFINIASLNTDVLIPLFLLLVYKLALRPTFRMTMLTGLVISCIILGGNPSASLYTTLFGVSFYFFYLFVGSEGGRGAKRRDGETGNRGNGEPERWRDGEPGKGRAIKNFQSSIVNRQSSIVTPNSQLPTPNSTDRKSQIGNRKSEIARGVGRIFFALALGTVLSLIVLPSFLEYLHRAWHYHIPGMGMLHLSIKQVGSTIFPWLYGNSMDLLFTGVDKLGLNPPDHLFPYQQVLVPRVMPYMGLGVLILSLLGLFRLKQAGNSSVFFAAGGIFMLGIVYGIPPFSLLGKVPIFNKITNLKYAVPLATFSIAFFAGVGLESKIFKNSRWKSLIVLLCVVELFFLHNHYHKKIHLITSEESGILSTKGLKHKSLRGIFFGQDNLFSYPEVIKEDEGYFRVADATGIFPPNLSGLYSVDDLYSHDPIYPRSYFEFINMINRHSPFTGHQYFFNDYFLKVRPEELKSRFLDLLGLKYVITTSSLPPTDLISKILSEAELHLFEGGSIYPTEFTISGITLPTLFQHPYSKIVLSLLVPEGDSKIRFSLGMHPQSFDKDGDGVTFKIGIHDKDTGIEKDYVLDPAHNFFHRRWIDGEMDISMFSGEEVRLILETSPGPKGDYRHDWAGWGDLRIVGGYIKDKFELVQGGDVNPVRKFFSGHKPTLKDGNFSNGVHPVKSDEVGAKQFHGVKVYRNKDAFARAFILPRFRIAHSHADAMSLLKDSSLRLDEVAIIEIGERREETGDKGRNRSSDLLKTVSRIQETKGRNQKSEIKTLRTPYSVRAIHELPLHPTPNSATSGIQEPVFRGKERLYGGVKSVSYNQSKVEIETISEEGGVLVLSDTYYPGWKAYLDGRRVKIYRADYVLRAIILPEGSHHVEFIYDPISFKVGSLISVCSLLIFIVGLFYNKNSIRG